MEDYSFWWIMCVSCPSLYLRRTTRRTTNGRPSSFRCVFSYIKEWRVSGSQLTSCKQQHKLQTDNKLASCFMTWAAATLRWSLGPNQGWIHFPVEEYKQGAVGWALMQTLNWRARCSTNYARVAPFEFGNVASWIITMTI